MKSSLCIFALAGLVLGCNRITGPTDGRGLVLVTFSMTDTTGKAATQFHSGEDFDLSVSLLNTSKDTITYHSGLPILSFLIFRDSAAVAGSAFGCLFPQVVITGHIAPGKALENTWRGPASLCLHQKVYLNRGSYEARAYLPVFDSISVTQVTPIAFSVVQ